MKIYRLILTGIISTLAGVSAGAGQAATQGHALPQGDFPMTMECRSGDTALPETFHFFNFSLTGDAYAIKTDLDASGMELETDAARTTFMASNECDNSYEFHFGTDQLKLLAAGKRKQIKGAAIFFNAYQEPAEDDDYGWSFATITCGRVYPK